MKISVSFLKSKYSLHETLQMIDQSSADMIHVDLMDGSFVEAKTDNLSEIIMELKQCVKPLDVHLMMEGESLQRTLDEITLIHPERIAIPSELANTRDLIREIQSHHILCGIAVNPDTSLESIQKYFKEIDFVLIMSVYPGRGGQAFLESTILKLQQLKKMREEQDFSFEICIDGGIHFETAQKVAPYCDTLVSGSYICMSDDYEKQITELRNGIS